MQDFGPLVSADWLADHRDDVHLFDSRSYLDGRSGHDAFRAGHLPGAVFVSIDNDLAAPPSQPGGRHPFPEPAHFAAAMSRLGYAGAKPAVIYDDAGGGMAARLWFMLTLLELPAAVLDGGMQTWEGPLEMGEHVPTPALFEAEPWPTERLVDAEEVAASNRGGWHCHRRSQRVPLQGKTQPHRSAVWAHSRSDQPPVGGQHR